MLKKDSNDEASGIFEKCGLLMNVEFTMWDDCAIMPIVGCGLGVSILPKLILKRTLYRLVPNAVSGLQCTARDAKKILEYL